MSSWDDTAVHPWRVWVCSPKPKRFVELMPLQVLQTMLQCLFFVDIRDALIRHWPDNQPITD